MTFNMRLEADLKPGLMTLGPAPDQADLRSTLAPLYEAGSQAAHALFWNEDDHDPILTTQRVAVKSELPSQQPEYQLLEPEAPVPEQISLTERIIDALAGVQCAKSNDLAKQLDESTASIRTELLELEEMGLVTRTGKTRGTRWWIG
jgi:predicted Rossmann fold nucleotide-binding protein DprA/Smf involved in DNA uptake